MDPLTLTVVCVLCASQPHNASPETSRWQPLIHQASLRFAIPESWIARVMLAESGGQATLNGQPITSSAGAMGLMQIMPRTYEELRRRYGLGDDPYAVRDNILAGTAYLSELYDRYGYPNLFAAYQAGPRRLDAFLMQGKPLPAATLAYVDSIIPGDAWAYSRPGLAHGNGHFPTRNLIFVRLKDNPLATQEPNHVNAAEPRNPVLGVVNQGNSSNTLFVALSPARP